jgi:TonB family protein
MKMVVAMVLALGVLCGGATAQSTEAEISARLMGKPLQLRGFWMDDKLKFDAAGTPVDVYKTGPFTTSAFELKKVSISGDRLKLEGIRVGLTFSRDGRMARVPMVKGGFGSSSPEKMTIEVDGHGNRDFTKELDAIFAETLEDLTPSLPDYWQHYANGHFLAWPKGDGSAVPNAKPSKIGGTVKPPRLLKSVDPAFDAAARDLKYSGDALVRLHVETDGTPSHIMIDRPIGLGLDEQAVAAVARYRFAPATRDGEPVVVELSVDVNFQIF